MGKFYHYTNSYALTRILSSHTLTSSPQRKLFPKGVYFTKLHKKDGYSQEDIAWNNWGPGENSVYNLVISVRLKFHNAAYFYENCGILSDGFSLIVKKVAR